MEIIPRLKPHRFAFVVDGLWCVIVGGLVVAAISKLHSQWKFLPLLILLILIFVLPWASTVYTLLRIQPRAIALTARTLREELSVTPVNVPRFLRRGIRGLLIRSLAPALMGWVILFVVFSAPPRDLGMYLTLASMGLALLPIAAAPFALTCYMIARCSRTRGRITWHVPVLIAVATVAIQLLLIVLTIRGSSSEFALEVGGFLLLAPGVGLIVAGRYPFSILARRWVALDDG